MGKIKAGIIGTGNISGIYLKNGSRFDSMEIVACADLDVERAKARAAEYGIRGCSVEELLASDDIQLVINLTIPQAHASVCIQALEAGKHVYVEKPLSVTSEEARRILETAERKGLRVGGAPDTFLGGGIQSCIKLIDEGKIGTPIGATAFMMSGGHESWHPDPAFYYRTGGGPMFDMGPYYLTALVSMLGPISRVTGSARISFPERTITSKPKAGEKVEVEVPTHVAGILDFASGPIGTILTSFDVKGGSTLPWIEVYGSEGSLLVPDPNNFGGTIRLRKAGEREWTDIPLTHGSAENARGIGAADMAKAIRDGRPHRANGALAYHVLEAMEGFHAASGSGTHYAMKSSCERPAPLPAGLSDFALD
ncbi:Gfo/Idh/MocA family protein [Cohnella thailandensis]|uniref:Gfo/Idh/MocA family oxidoreductase n=1 Tax=Cohnella thailandensis TaxID=557557 RepID=A0A841TAG3_9BACL|nr:Gfo/Idh/MocA family oxidoreductase [Cohnella thailandensis]MBB6638211.1 Gfo/Idh/MocA family oxidoreductase [Cohnella thailandensis]MBP1977769.1 putative dehydrogenase [Cohnella thailandensis]